MATNPGIRIPDGEFHFLPSGAVPLTFVPPIIGYHDPVLEAGLGQGGKHERINSPLGPRKSNAYPFNVNNGILISGWLDLFWKNHLHIIPVPAVVNRSSADVDLLFEAGNVLSTIQTQYEIYNGYDRPQSNTVRTLNTLTGVNEISPPAVTTIFGGKESIVYTVDVTPQGPATIDGNISHDFPGADGAPVLLFSIEGNRLLLFGYEPQRPVSEQWEWVTDVIQAVDGGEQRFMLRHLPKQSFIFQYIFDDEVASRKLENFLRTFGTLKIGHPDWLSLTELTAPTAVNDFTIAVLNTVNRDFRALGGDQDGIVIFQDADNFETKVATVISNQQIDFGDPILNVWPSGTTVMPFRVGQFHDNWNQTLYALDRREIVLSFEVLDSIDHSDESGFTLYKTRPVFEDVLGLGDSRDYKRGWQWDMITTGARTSRQSRKTLRRFPKISSSYVMPWDSRTEFVVARNWLFSRRGKQKDFWLPSWRDDVPQQEDSTSNTEIRAQQLGYEGVFDQGFVIDILVRFTDGTTDFREITSVVPTGNHDLLTVDSALSKTPTLANVDRIEFLTLHRLNTDRLTFRHDWVSQDSESMTGETMIQVVEIIE